MATGDSTLVPPLSARPLAYPHRISAHLNAPCVVIQPVEDAIGDGRIVDLSMRARRRHATKGMPLSEMVNALLKQAQTRCALHFAV